MALNPGHPSWYNLWLSQAALFQGEIDLALRTGRETPEDANLVTLGIAEALSGNVEAAQVLFSCFQELTGFRSLSSWWWIGDLRADPVYAPWVKGAEIAGFPVTDEETDRAAVLQ